LPAKAFRINQTAVPTVVPCVKPRADKAERATVGEYYQRCFNEEIPTGGFTTRKFN